MNKYLFDDALIDIAGIWAFEQDKLREGANERIFVQELRQSLIPFYILKKKQPFISNAIARKDPSIQSYYNSYLERSNLHTDWDIDYFKYREAFYDLNVSCIIEKGDVIPELYAWLFALKLRKFEESNEGLEWFLGFHYHKTFNGEKQAYSELLSSMKFYDDLLNPETITDISTAAEQLDSLPPASTYHEQKTERPSLEALKNLSINVDSETEELQELKSQVDEKPLEIEIGSAEKPVSSNAPYLIPNVNNLTNSYIDHFFSFLHKDRGEDEGSYLTKEQVETMLQNGITVPAQPLQEKFKLNWTNRYTKKLAEYLLHKFIIKYNANEKSNFLRFLGSYIKDYESALQLQGLRNVSKNFTGEEPTSYNLRFKSEDFLPGD